MHRFCKFIWGIHSVPPNLCQLGHSSTQRDSKLKHKDHSCACCQWPLVRPWSSASSPMQCMVWGGSLLDHVADGVIQFFLPRHGLGHAEIDPSSNWIIDRQEPSWPQEHDTDASWQFWTSKKLIPIAVQMNSMMVLCFRMTLRASRESWGMLLLLPLLAKSTYRITPVNI